MATSVRIDEDLGVFTSAPDRPGGSLGTGRFSAYLCAKGRDHEPGPVSVAVADAIAWGRSRASTVIVLVCDDQGGAAHFSAGEKFPEDWQVGPLYRWPEDGGLLAARQIASGRMRQAAPVDEHDAVVTVNWEVELTVFGGAPRIETSFVDAWADALGREPAVVEVLRAEPLVADPVPGPLEEGGFWARTVLPAPFARVHVILGASTRDQAESVATGLATRTAARTMGELGVLDASQRLACRARATVA